MFDNIGHKIKLLAQVMCWLGIGISVFIGILLIFTGMDQYDSGIYVGGGIAVLCLGSLFSWIGSFVLCGFGELVENSDIRTELAVKKAMQKESEK